MIPGPAETAFEYEKRLDKIKHATKCFKQEYPHRKIACIDGFPVYFGKKGLKFWEAGAFWIYEDKNKEKLPLIQLKKDSIDVFAHEKIHAQRMAFNENRFEEILAFYTSKNRLRKFWGPLFRTQKSLWAFLIFSVIPLFDIRLLCLSAGMLIWQSLRLLIDHKRLKKVISKLGSFESALYLTDCEILAFAKWPKEKILAHLKTEAAGSLRICKLMQIMS